MWGKVTKNLKFNGFSFKFSKFCVCYNRYTKERQVKIMLKFCMTIEKGMGDMWSVKICDADGRLYRYFASISNNLELLQKIKEYFDNGDVSPIHIDDIFCDLLSI